MVLYVDSSIETVRFGAEALKKALEKKSIFYVERALRRYTGKATEQSVVASIAAAPKQGQPARLEAGGFEIRIDGNTTHVIGGDANGLMYGLMDLAETIELFGPEAVSGKLENPTMKLRGVKFNLPFQPYTNGDPFEKNVQTCKDMNFWRSFIDFLAMHRYNCLSLWSEHPFHMMFRLEKYPDTCPYSEEELAIYKQLYKFIFGHAKSRGIDVYLITWNIRLPPPVAKGLGLPAELGNGYKTGENDIPSDFEHSGRIVGEHYDRTRQQLDVVKDYFKQCIQTLAMTYPDLKGIGTNAAEEMAGSAEERHQWVADVYIDALNEIGSKMPFIIRTNMGNGKIAKEIVLDRYHAQEKYISWKYSNAHMYSHPEPQFERLWGAWDDVDMSKVKVLYTVRNDDIHTLRWGDPEFIRAHIRGMQKPYVHGFYWGADSYLWGIDFQHAPNSHKTWTYDFEKNWYQFALLGRLGYNVELDNAVWQARFRAQYSQAWGDRFYQALKAASAIIPAVNRLFWINYDFQWHPECLLSRTGFKTILDFVNGAPMPGVGTIGIREFAAKKLTGEPIAGESPEGIIRILHESVSEAEKIAESLEQAIPAEYLDGDVACTLLDIKAWGKLGAYYAHKFEAALALALFEKSGEQALRDSAVSHLREGVACWKALSEIWASHYLPYRMVRTLQLFGWSYYTHEVEQDIRLAEELTWKTT